MKVSNTNHWFPFNPEKAIEAISYFLSNYEGKSMPMIKLIKMLYYSEKESLKMYDFPIFGEELYSLPFGPVVSKSYDMVKEENLKGSSLSENFKREGKYIQLIKEVPIEKLSEAEIEIMSGIFERFKGMTEAQIIDYGHDKKFTPEWRDPGSSSIPIAHQDLFHLFDRSESEIREIQEYAKECRSLELATAKYAY